MEPLACLQIYDVADQAKLGAAIPDGAEGVFGCDLGWDGGKNLSIGLFVVVLNFRIRLSLCKINKLYLVNAIVCQPAKDAKFEYQTARTRRTRLNGFGFWNTVP